MFLHPYLSIRCCFFLPDRCNAFQFINTPLACLEGISPVGGADNNQHYVLSYAYLTDPVDYIDLYYVIVLKRLLSYLVQFFFCHTGIVLKVKFADLPAAGGPSAGAKEYNNASDITGNCLN